MEEDSIIKKIFLVIILMAIFGFITFVVINSSSGKKEAKVSNKTTISKSVGNNVVAENTDNTDKKKVTVTDLGDGTKYSVKDDDYKPDIVVGDNYYGTQINDITINFSQYEGKTIEIEGLFFKNNNYTFVGRYSTNVVCMDCPVGYSYFEYEWNGDEKISLVDSENWIKVRGTLRKGNDGTEYYYIEADSVSVMNEQGITKVSN